MLPSKDINFVGYTYKNYEIVDANAIPGFGKFISLSLSLTHTHTHTHKHTHTNVCLYASLRKFHLVVIVFFLSILFDSKIV
jgi:hypothetical protein